MLKHKRLISIIATIAFCLSFLAPALIAPAPAVAANMYQVVKSATVKPGSGYQNLDAVVKVVIPDIQIASGSRVTVSLPSDWDVNGGVVKVDNEAVANTLTIVASGTKGNIDDDTALSVDAFVEKNIAVSPNKSFDIQLANDGSQGANKYFYIYFNGINLNNTTGDMDITFFAPAGSVFQTSAVTIGKSSRSGSTYTSIKKVNQVTSEGGAIDIITINEMQAGTLNLGGTITLKILTKGVTWRAAGAASYGWDFMGSVNPGAGKDANLDPIQTSYIKGNDKEIKYPIHKDAKAVNGEPGRISFANLEIDIDDEKANVGDTIQVKVSGADMTSVTLDVATYADYGVSLKEGTSTDIIAGKEDQDVGTFTIEEAARGTLVDGRTIKVTLPDGVKWHAVNGEMETVNNSDLNIDNPNNVTGSDNHILLFAVENESSDNAGKVEFKDFTVDVAPDFVGPIEVAVTGSAGVEGKVKIAEVKPAVTISVDSLKNINLGMANQALGDITLTEGLAEGLEDGNLVLMLDDTYRWSKKPTVKVTEGDIDIDEDVKIDNEKLTIKIKTTSSKASTIVISDVYIDAFRSAPEGPIYLKIGDVENDKCTAIMDFDYDEWEDISAGKAQVATCVTPASTTGRSASFYIGSTIMNVNGANVIMDVAPYIKAGRTYVPVRYLANALGVTDENVGWDADTKTVTLTKDDKSIILVIGNTTANVNGADQVMDVAPEIKDGRTMLPARYVAEGLGYAVGWNAALQQVVIQ